VGNDRPPARHWRIGRLTPVAAAYCMNSRKPDGNHGVFRHPAVIEALAIPARHTSYFTIAARRQSRRVTNRYSTICSLIVPSGFLVHRYACYGKQ